MLSEQLLALFEHRSPESFMDLALRQAERAREADEVPVGAIVVDVPTGRIIAQAHNQRELLKDPTAHAEILAITQAAAYYESWRLETAALFVTLEPCLMCSGAIVLARVPFVHYGTPDPKAGAHDSIYDVLANPANNHLPKVSRGLREEACSSILTEFFRTKRARTSKPNSGTNGATGGPSNGTH